MSDALFIKRNRPATVIVEAGYTRPADTATYTAGDVLCNSTSSPTILSFDNCARSAGLGGIIQGAIMVDSSAPTLKADVELYLFDTTVTMQNDNAAWTPTDAQMKTCIGRIRFAPGLFNIGNGNGIVDVETLGKPFKCAPASTTLYGITVIRNSYIPTSAEEFLFRLLLIQD